MDTVTYIKFLRAAKQITRRADEAEDLLQTVLLVAIEADRHDLTRAENRRWLIGALRKRALFDARSAIRRRRREGAASTLDSVSAKQSAMPLDLINTLPPALRTTTLLILTGHTRREIIWLLRLTDAALRQRIKEIRRRWRLAGGEAFTEIPGLGGELAYGQLRQSMLHAISRHDSTFASHDPDGHIFLMCSQNSQSRQPVHRPRG